jgi:plastocyanin
MSQNRLRPLAAVLLAAAATLGACAADEPKPPAGPPPDAKRVDTSTAGTIAGRVLLDGPSPVNAPIKMSADPFCIRANKDGAALESFVVEDGGLDNVFVHVKDGLGSYWFDTPAEPVKLDQSACRYTPHVFGVRVGQPIEISNSDNTLHNVHALASENREFNFGQPVAGMKNTHAFSKPEVMITFKCDVHSWMNSYAGVVAHPYFAVTANGGRFELRDVPAGTYTIETWHEKLGTQTQSVTIGEKESKEISFSYKSPAAATN